MQYQGIIFDLDGVLCSTDEYHYRAWKALADRLGIPFDRERNGLLRGVSRMDSLNIILEKSDKAYSQEEKNAMAEEKNTRYRQLLNQMERMGLDGFFDAVADGNCITHSKPNPEVFLKAAEMLGLKPEQCVVVEDAHAGVEAAKAGGFACAAMGDAKEDARATYHLGKLSDLLEYVG